MMANFRCKHRKRIYQLRDCLSSDWPVVMSLGDIFLIANFYRKAYLTVGVSIPQHMGHGCIRRIVECELGNKLVYRNSLCSLLPFLFPFLPQAPAQASISDGFYSLVSQVHPFLFKLFLVTLFIMATESNQKKIGICIRWHT